MYRSSILVLYQVLYSFTVKTKTKNKEHKEEEEVEYMIQYSVFSIQLTTVVMGYGTYSVLYSSRQH